MNRGLFGSLVVLFCIALVVFMGSCEYKDDSREVKIVLDKHINTVAIYRQFRVHKIGDRSIYFWSTDLPYEVGDTVVTTIGRLQQ